MICNNDLSLSGLCAATFVFKWTPSRKFGGWSQVLPFPESRCVPLKACLRVLCVCVFLCVGRTMRHESLTHSFRGVGVQDVCFKALDQGAVPTKMCIRFSVNSCKWQVSAGQSLDSIASLFGSNYVQVCL